MLNILHPRGFVCLGLVTLLALSACEQTGTGGSGDDDPLVIYSGRSQSLVRETIERFAEESGINVEVRYGDTAQLAVTLREEGDRSPADVFWAQDAGALGQMASNGRFQPLPDSVLQKVPAAFRHPGGYWGGTSGRARVLAYAPSRVDEENLPASVFDLTDEQWRGRVGWAPTNGSFQAFVTGMRHVHGDDVTRQWLADMRDNDAQVYANNTSIVSALGNEEVDLGLVNHYYLLRFKDEDPDYPVAQTAFETGDIGNLVLVSGVGILDTARHTDAAARFIDYLLSAEAAGIAFTEDNFEYPISTEMSARPELEALPLSEDQQLDELAPDVPLDALDDLDGTLQLLREVNLL